MSSPLLETIPTPTEYLGVDLNPLVSEVQKVLGDSWRLLKGKNIVWRKGKACTQDYLTLFFFQEALNIRKKTLPDLPDGVIFYRDKYTIGAVEYSHMKGFKEAFPQINEVTCPKFFAYLKAFARYC